MTSKIDRKIIEKDLRSLISKIAEVDETEVTLDANFVEDLGMDSMMALEIHAAVEKKYQLKIPEDYLGKIISLQNVIDLTSKFISKK